MSDEMRSNIELSRHARLFELIRQQNLAAARAQKARTATADLTDAQAFIEAARSTLGKVA